MQLLIPLATGTPSYWYPQLLVTVRCAFLSLYSIEKGQVGTALTGSRSDEQTCSDPAERCLAICSFVGCGGIASTTARLVWSAWLAGQISPTHWIGCRMVVGFGCCWMLEMYACRLLLARGHGSLRLASMCCKSMPGVLVRSECFRSVRAS